jgi:hypothetical protein
MFARSRDDMLEEFQRMDHRMKLPEKEEFREFIEHDVPAPPEVSELDAIPTPKTIDADFAPLIAMQEALPEPKKGGVEGIIGRMRDALAGRMGTYEGPQKREGEFPIGKLIGALTLMGLCLGIFTIPAAIREAATGKSSEQLAHDQMRILIEEDISSETPNTARDEARASYGGQGSSSGGQGGPGSGGGDQGGGGGETLSFARSLAAKGNVEAAIGYYEQAITANPAAIGARLELIQAYLTTKKHVKARQLCLSTLKCRLTDSEIALVWSLLRQCLSN